MQYASNADALHRAIADGVGHVNADHPRRRILAICPGRPPSGWLLLGHTEGGVTGGQHATWPGQIRVRRQGLEPRTRGLRVRSRHPPSPQARAL
jgi:hypothetical protein